MMGRGGNHEASTPPRPVDEQAQQEGATRQAEQQGVTELHEFAGIEGELELVDPPGRDVELMIPVYGPVHRIQERGEIALILNGL